MLDKTVLNAGVAEHDTMALSKIILKAVLCAMHVQCTHTHACAHTHRFMFVQCSCAPGG